MTPALCGTFLTDKRSLVAFTWTITTVLTLVAFIVAAVMMAHTHTHYIRLERYYEQQMEYNKNQYDDDENGDNNNNKNDSSDKQMEEYLLLATMGSKSLTFAAVYTMILAIGLCLYGSTAIVGFTSLRGVYIAPCFSSSGSPKLKLGVFGGAIIFFANLLLVCAVVFGEVRVEDWKEGNRDGGDEKEPYEVERIATILAVVCMFLSALYSIFAVLLFLYFGNEESGSGFDEEAVAVKPLPGGINSDPRRETFITMHDR